MRLQRARIHDYQQGKLGGVQGQGWKRLGYQTREYVPRLQGRFAFSKALLRPYAGDSGSCVYAPTIDPESAFGKNHLRQALDSKNSELVRRPALGISIDDCSFGSCLCGSGQTRRKDQEKPSGTGQDCKAVGWDRRQKVFGCVQDAFAGAGCQVGSEELEGAGWCVVGFLSCEEGCFHRGVANFRSSRCNFVCWNLSKRRP